MPNTFQEWVYAIFVNLHSILRWVIILFALLSIVRAANGLSFKRGFTQTDSKINMWFTSTIDTQVLLGIILYFTSSLTSTALQDFGSAMANPVQRFFAVEHVFGMVVAMIVAHVGRAMIKKGVDARAKHRRTMLWVAITMIIILIAIPWPFYAEFGRGLLPPFLR
jgi:uncharacterized membrane protein YozB (DUF420 family)